jgi:hypothetical protein
MPEETAILRVVHGRRVLRLSSFGKLFGLMSLGMTELRVRWIFGNQK